MVSVVPQTVAVSRAAATVAAIVALGTALVAPPAIAETRAQPAIASQAVVPERLDVAREIERLVAGDEMLAPIYAARSHAALWSGPEGRARAEAALAAFASATEHALPSARYGGEDLTAERAAAIAPDALAAFDLAMTRAYLRYARDVGSGLLEPRRVDRELYVRPERPDPAALVAKIARSADPEATLAALAPADEGYHRLRAQLAAYERLAHSSAWENGLAKGATLRLGDRSDRVETLRRRLIAIGDLRPEAVSAPATSVVASNEVMTDLPAGETDPRLFDAALEVAVERFQARHGLNVDGAVGPATRGALNAAPAKRARQIAVNLERIRWLNRDLGARHVMVNLAGFEMALVDNGAPIFTSRVVVGQGRRHRTPEFSDEMEYMVVNPTWHVPASIAREEILPELQADPSYLERKNMRLEGADASLIDWTFVTPDSFPGRVKQGPGPGNALGRVKFMFPNDHAIYLHDTPQRRLFARDRRDFSHGCVRVQKPLDFARLLLSFQRDDADSFFQRYLDRGTETYLNLREHLPVHITYRTAWVEADGTEQFRADVYGRDARVFAALEKAGLALALD